MVKTLDVNDKDVLSEVKQYITNPDNLKLIEKALAYAQDKHAHQMRKNGDPYIIHIYNVSYILATLRSGPKTICAGILHDIIEDCDISKAELAEEFDEEIATLVESVTKIGNISFKDMKEYQAANHRKLFIAMAKDVRVIIIKLVDRLHNMRTLQYMPKEKQQRIASETLEVYAPIAHRLGISEIKNELEDLSFFYLNEAEYRRIAKLLEAKKSERDAMINKTIVEIGKLLTKHNIQYRIFGRSKHIYSIYRKMTVKMKRFDEILDLLAIRIVTQTELNCYEILGYIHDQYRPIPGRLKDYIAMPKVNMYQSLHTTIVGNKGSIFEIQIRTEKMDSIAERGIAAHWHYKEGTRYDPNIEQKEIEDKLSWFKEFRALTGESDENAPTDYMEALTRDIFEANVYVMTPHGKVIALPNGSTPIDFAYRVHTDVGHSCVGAIVNDALVPLNTVLKTGDVVQIKTSKQFNEPSEDWLKFVKTNQAKNKIKAFLSKKETEKRNEKVDVGEKILAEELKRRGFDTKEYMDKKKIEGILASLRYESYTDLMYHLAQRSINAITVVERLTNQKRPMLENEIINKINAKEVKKKSTSKNGLKVNGIHSMMMSLAHCCSPVMNDEIIGYITKGHGIKVHRINCPNVMNLKERLIAVEWEKTENNHLKFDSNIIVISRNRNFLFTDIVTTVAQYKGNLLSIHSTVNQEELTVTTQMTIQVNNLEHLNAIIVNIQKLDSVIKINREFK